MDIIPSYEEMQTLYSKYFSLDFLGSDINNKFALISLTCYLTSKLKVKKPDVTHLSILCAINNKGTTHVPEDYIKRLAVVCSDFAYGCTQFPTFGIDDKDIPAKIKEIMSSRLPF